MMGNSTVLSTVMAAGLIIVFVVIGIWDVWVTFGPGVGPSVSEVLHDWAIAYPPLTLIIGIILGHILFPLVRR